MLKGRKSARKPQSKRSDNDPEQYQRFVEAARVAEASNDPKDLEAALKKIIPSGAKKESGKS